MVLLLCVSLQIFTTENLKAFQDLPQERGRTEEILNRQKAKVLERLYRDWLVPPEWGGGDSRDIARAPLKAGVVGCISMLCVCKDVL